MKTCSRVGCERQARARGMCDSHYTMFMRTYTGPRVVHDSPALVGEQMPGTFYQLAERTKMSYDTVHLIVAKLHANGEAFICDWLPPMCFQGSRWMAVFNLGRGRDKLPPTDAEKRAHRNSRNRSKRAAKMLRQRGGGLATPFAQLFQLAPTASKKIQTIR
jgi:hypothetical protein